MHKITIKTTLICVFIFLSAFKVSAQVDTVHQVYGLVIGISEYRNGYFYGLKYADDDATMFANFLKSHLIKPADSSNIVLLTNKQVNPYAVWNEIFKIESNAKTGDTVYFFFSGHGDAKSVEHVFLICYEGIKGQYEGGDVIRIDDLKDHIKQFNYRGVKVILIIDACRSNEINSKTSNVFFTEAMNQNTGEIQLSSCSKNEMSYEDKRWGNGHGVFSFYLVKGWMGMADADTNRRITFEELSRYVGDHVSEDLCDNEKHISLQTPYFYSPKQSTLMASVNPVLKKKLMAKEASGDNDLREVLIPRYFPKGLKNLDIKDTVALDFYFKLDQAIQNEQFLKPDSASAVFYYEKFKELMKSGKVLNDVRLDLIAGMANKAQSYIQEFLQGNNSFSSYDFSNAANLMYKAMSMMDSSHEMYTSLKARALFLKANSLMDDQYDMAYALEKLDSSLKLEPNKAYVFYDKARIYEFYNLYFDSAEINYLRAIKLAPQWVRPVIDIAYLNINHDRFEKGSEYIHKSIQMQPGPYIYYLLGYTYQNLSDSASYGDSAILYYQKALELDSNYVNALLGLALIYQARLETEKSKEYYIKALALDSTYYYTNYCYGNLFYNAKMNDWAEYYYKKTIEYYPKYPLAHWMLANTYRYRLDEGFKAVAEYRECLTINYYDTRAYTAIGEILLDSEYYDLAIQYLKIPRTYDSKFNPVDLGRAYLLRAMRDSSKSDFESAIIWLDTSDYYFPGDYYTKQWKGTYYLQTDNIPKSITNYTESARLNSSHYYNWYILGNIHYEMKHYDTAIYFYKMGIQNAPASMENYKKLWQLYQYKTKEYALATLVADSAIMYTNYTNYFYYLKTYSLWANGEFDAANTAIDSAIRLYPDYANYLWAKAMVLSSLNREEEALEFLKASINAGVYAEESGFFDGTFKNIEESKKFKKMVKKYLKKIKNKK